MVAQHDKEIQRAVMTSGELYKTAVLLVNFNDIHFTTPFPQQAFSNMLNQPGYSYDGSTGSVVDYYKANSNGRFNPQFDVYGAYTLPQNRSYYAASESGWREMAMEAVRLADPYVDFSQYADGTTARSVYIFFAGEVLNNGTTVWPHKWEFSSAIMCDGVGVRLYACSGEFETQRGTTRARIGTFSHEFGHVIGWPDFYDTDYAANGQGVTIGDYSLMDNGCYSNESRTPPAFNAIERMLQGWLTPKEFEYSHQYTLKPVSDDEAYIIKTDVENEYFLIENRSSSDSKGPNIWEAALAAEVGVSLPLMMVYHVDKSNNMVANIPAWQLWEYYNDVNSYASHECFKAVRAERNSYQRFWGYPGVSNTTYLSSDDNAEFRAWSGKKLNEKFTSISRSGNNIVFELDNGNMPPVEITATLDKSNINIITGDSEQLNATVVPEEYAAQLMWSSSNTAVATVDANGLVTAVAAGYATITAEVAETYASVECNITVNDLAMSMSNSNVEIYVGNRELLTVAVSPEGFTYELEWSSSDTDVATVDDNGLVTAVAQGEATITAKLKERDDEVSCHVTVLYSDIPVTIDAVHQNDIWVHWEYGQEYDGIYRVEIRRDGAVEAVVTSSESRAYADKLRSGTSYVMAVYLDDNGAAGEQIGGMNFTTPKAATFPASVGFTAPDTEGRTMLYLQDVAGEITSVQWRVNGKALEYPRFDSGTAGRYTVTAEYETVKSSETITKVIIIK